MSVPSICDGLFGGVEALLPGRLSASGLGRLLPGEIVVDLFCGAGGWTAAEGVRSIGVRPAAAVNHSPVAIAWHQANCPECEHHQGDAWKVKPRAVTGKRPVGLLLASAACTTHSNARGAAPISQRVHMLGWCIARWMEEARPRIVLVENVAEWQRWGPTRIVRGTDGAPKRHDNGRVMREADPEREGQHWRRWLRFCRRLGYAVEFRVLNAVDYGAASKRKRLFVVMRRDGAPIVWPEATHGPSGILEVGHCRPDDRNSSHVRQGGLRDGQGDPVDAGARQRRDVDRGDKRHQHRSGPGAGSPIQRAGFRTAADVIDWSDLGTSIFERPRPLKPKTLARIAEGIRRYVLEDPRPFVLRVTQAHAPGGGWHVAPVDEPLRTQTTRQDLAVCTPVLMNNTSGHRGGRADGPLPTITTGGQAGLVAPIISRQYGDKGGSSIAAARPDAPLGTVTAVDHHSLVTPLLATVGWGERAGQAPRCSPVGAPLNGIPAGGVKAGLVAPLLQYHNHGENQWSRAGEPLKTITAGGLHAGLVAAFLVSYYSQGKQNGALREPLDCITTIDRHGLVVVKIGGEPYVIVDILFRMLRPHELAAAMGFPETYRWPAVQRDAVRLIGNAVAPPMAEALIRAVLPEQGQGPQREERAA